MDAVFCHNTRSNISLTRYDRHHEPASGIGVIASGISPGQEKGMKSAIVILSSLLLLTACGGGGGGSDSDSSNDAQPRYTVSATAGNGGSVTPASQTIGHGSQAFLAVVPDSGYSIDQVSGCNIARVSGDQFATAALTGPCQINATFTNLLQPFTASAGDALIDLSWQVVENATQYCIYHATSPDIDPAVPASYATGGRTCIAAPFTQHRLESLTNL